MNKRNRSRVVWLWMGLAGLIIAGAGMAHPQPQDALDPAVLEAFLGSARVVAVDQEAAGGRTAPWIVTLNDGNIERRAIFKYVDRRRPTALPDSYHYELAAYRVSRLIGLPIVPPVVPRTIEGIPGSIQIYAENCEKIGDLKRRGIDPPDPAAFRDALSEIRIFENLVLNECANLDDTLVHKTTWNICRVDFSEAFAPKPSLIPGCEITRCSRRLFAGLRSLDPETLRTALSDFLNEDEIRALAGRFQLILERLDGLIRTQGEAAVLFGPGDQPGRP
jgi:hypothetical protein